mmetsp:Transcript_9044/g.17226  ORF Transcript_9044/g.17226 Transcript_9044/m.17226 type:complete len:86 (+) Transcript_9044:432-689(+)
MHCSKRCSQPSRTAAALVDINGRLEYICNELQNCRIRRGASCGDDSLKVWKMHVLNYNETSLTYPCEWTQSRVDTRKHKVHQIHP